MRRLALALTLAFAPVFAGGCAPSMQAQTEFSSDTDFAVHQSYRWITEDLVLIQSGTGNERIRNVENEKRIRAAVERELDAKGLSKAEGEAASLILAFTVGTKVRYKFQGGGSNVFDLVTDEGSTTTKGTLTLYMFDRDSGEQIWQAWTSRELEPGADPDAIIDAAVGLLMAEFPPG